jgi:hypothetical protein
LGNDLGNAFSKIVDEEFSLVVSVTIDRPPSGEDSAADTPIGLPRKQTPRSQRRANPAGRDTQLHREHAPETVCVQVQCLHELQATLQLQ